MQYSAYAPVFAFGILHFLAFCIFLACLPPFYRHSHGEAWNWAHLFDRFGAVADVAWNA